MIQLEIITYFPINSLFHNYKESLNMKISSEAHATKVVLVENVVFAFARLKNNWPSFSGVLALSFELELEFGLESSSTSVLSSLFVASSPPLSSSMYGLL